MPKNDETSGAFSRAVSSRPRAGEKIGRFSILSEVGAGGMGRIYEAYDPNLERRVALKLLHDTEDDGHRERLVREAKALARLDHPNVVRIHDVGTHEGVFFVAMEFTRGGTLEQWIANHPVGEKERFETVTRLLIGAGRGLVAAHAVGLVHRDVKPSNILIGEDGRARIADFGIARPTGHGGASAASPADGSDETSLPSTDDSGSGRTGNSVSTPAYMAPEELGGTAADAAADQFSFCVTAWEALFGKRPFGQTEPGARIAAIRKGPARGRHTLKVAHDVEALLRRGLRYHPSQRHARLEDLVDALTRAVGGESTQQRRSPWRLGLAVVGIGVLAAGGAYAMVQADETCATEAGVAFQTVWGDTRRESVRRAVQGSGLDFAPGAWTRLEGGIDEYGEAWREAHTEVCEATRVRGEHSPERMEERIACLDSAKRVVDALLDLVSSGRSSVLASEQSLLQGLPSVDACTDARGVPTSREASMLDVAARAGVLRNVGQSSEALELVEPVARELGEETSPVVRAQVLLEYGLDLFEASNPRRALEPLKDAYALAQAQGSLSVLAATARAVAKTHTVLLSDPETIRAWMALAWPDEATLLLFERVDLLMLEGELSRLEGNGERAVELLERAVELAVRDPGLLPHARRRLAIELYEASPDDRAVEVARQALEEFRAEYGVEHPGLAVFESTLAKLLEKLKLSGAHAMEGEAAVEVAREALARAQKSWGVGHVSTSHYLVQLSSTLCMLGGDTEEGLALAKAALRLHREDEVTLSRYRALMGWITCAIRREDQFAKEAWDLVFLSKQIYGEKHQKTVLAQARYAQALVRAPHPENEGLWKQMLLYDRVGGGAGSRLGRTHCNLRAWDLGKRRGGRWQEHHVARTRRGRSRVGR